MSRWFRPTVHFLGGIHYRPTGMLSLLHLRLLHAQCRLSSVKKKPPTVPYSVGVPLLAAATTNRDVDPASMLVGYISMDKEGISRIPAHTLKSLYMSVKDRNLLPRLLPKQMTSMISMFGTLSIQPSYHACIYVSKFVPCVDNATESTYWPLVLEIGRDKKKLGYQLNGTDRFWAMRAELASVSLSPKVSAQLAQHYISQAMQQYVRIWRHTQDPEVHAPLLEALVSNSSTRNLADALKCLLRLLSLYDNPHNRLLDIFWKIVLEHGPALTPTQRSNILTLCFDRIGNHISDAKPIPHEAINITTLGAALAGQLFPRCLARLPYDSLQRWVQKITVATFELGLPLEARWSNLLLLAISVRPHDLKSVASSSHFDELTPAVVEWRTILILSSLERTITDLPFDAASHTLASILRSTWHLWKDMDVDRPLLASQAIIASFLRLSAMAGDKETFRGCVQRSRAQNLWSITENSSETAGGVHDVLTSYLIGLVNCHGKSWLCILDIVNTMAATPALRTKVLSALLRHIVVQDIMAAFEFYRFLLGRGFHAFPADIYSMATKLAASGRLGHAASLLQTPFLPPHLMERLLGDILRSLKSMRLKSLDSDVAKMIGDAMKTLYSNRKPLAGLKYSIRFSLSLLVSSGHASKAASIAEALAEHSSSFFTARFFTHFVSILVYHRQFRCAQRICQIARKIAPSRTIDIAQAKLAISLANAGSTKLARALYPDYRVTGRLRTKLSMVRVMAFRSRRPTAHATLRVLRVLSRHPLDGQIIQVAIRSLVRARRIAAAIKLVRSKCHALTPKSITAIGNTILHGLLGQRQRNGRLMVRILVTKTLLEKWCQFIPDQVTTNVIIKAVLLWHPVVDISQMKGLFDHFIRLGYSSGSRWHREDNVPFGSLPKSAHPSLELPILTSPLSFRKHVRPLYKTFIKAFYLRGDVNAAKTVIGILKEEQMRTTQKWEKRERARREGIHKKKQLLTNCHRKPTIPIEI